MSIVLTLAVIATWVLLALGFSAIGVLFLNRLTGGMEPAWNHVYYGIWTGFALLVAGLMLWHFFLAVNEIALFLFAVLAALALILERRWFTLVLRLPFSRSFAMAATVFVMWIANHALGKAGMDDNQYEFQTVRWFHDYAIVPGLANLHGRFGFNNSHHLFAAMLSAGFWRGSVNHIVNGFVVALACIFLLDAVWDLAKGTQVSLQRSLFPALLLCPCVGLVSFGIIGPMVSTLKADVFVCAATAVLAGLFLRWTVAPSGTSRSAVLTVTTLMIGCLIASVKLNGLVFCGFILAVVALRSLLQPAAVMRYKRALAGALTVGAMLVIAVPIRGMVLSGYPVYPLTALRLNADWSVPVAQAEAERAFITSFGRLRPTFDPHKLSGWRWVRGWARSTALTDKINIVLPLVLTFACLPLLFARPRKYSPADRTEEPPGWAYATLICASAATLLVWFIQAPDPRFVIVQVWILFASVFTWAVQIHSRGWSWNAPLIGIVLTLPAAAFVLLYYLRISGADRLGMIALLTFAALWILAFGFLRTFQPRLLVVLCLMIVLFQYSEHSIGFVLRRQFSALESLLWVNVTQLPHSDVPAPVIRETHSGLQIYVTGSAGYETPLPSTHYFNPFLQLRTARMQDGFRNPDVLHAAEYAENGGLPYKFEGWEKDLDTTVPFHLLDLQKPVLEP